MKSKHLFYVAITSLVCILLLGISTNLMKQQTLNEDVYSSINELYKDKYDELMERHYELSRMGDPPIPTMEPYEHGSLSPKEEFEHYQLLLEELSNANKIMEEMLKHDQ
jgi:hypothetical protein